MMPFKFLEKFLSLQISLGGAKRSCRHLRIGLRESLRGELQQILADLDIPVILVIHDHEEAQDLAEEVMAFPMGMASY